MESAGVTGAKRVLISNNDGDKPMDCSRDGHLDGSHWQRLEKAFPATTGNSSDGSGSRMDVAIFVYSIWPAEYHKYDSDCYMESLQSLSANDSAHWFQCSGSGRSITLSTPIRSPSCSHFWGSITLSVARNMSWCNTGGLGRLSITPIERYRPISTLLPMMFSSRWLSTGTAIAWEKYRPIGHQDACNTLTIIIANSYTLVAQQYATNFEI